MCGGGMAEGVELGIRNFLAGSCGIKETLARCRTHGHKRYIIVNPGDEGKARHRTWQAKVVTKPTCAVRRAWKGTAKESEGSAASRMDTSMRSGRSSSRHSKRWWNGRPRRRWRVAC